MTGKHIEPAWKDAQAETGLWNHQCSGEGESGMSVHCLSEHKDQGAWNETSKGQIYNSNVKWFLAQLVVKLWNSLPWGIEEANGLSQVQKCIGKILVEYSSEAYEKPGHHLWL